MRSPLFLLIAAFVVTMLVVQGMGLNAQLRGDPVDRMHALLLRRPELGPAIVAADRGDPGPLAAWLNRAENVDRFLAARALMAVAAAGVPEDAPARVTDPLFRRHLGRFLPFVEVPTGDAGLDLDIDNLVAYETVAEAGPLSDRQRALAQRLLPRLERAQSDKPSAAVADTIGCVRYVLGNFQGAKAAFAEAERLALADKPRPGLADELALYRRRLNAAGDAALRSVEQRTSNPPIPLPLP